MSSALDRPGGEHRGPRRAATIDAASRPAPAAVHEALRAPAEALDAATRGSMEPRFGHNFGQVRIHADGAAARSAREVHARAYTVGHDIVFGAGQYRPQAVQGRALLAHELAHVVQQGPGGATQGAEPRADRAAALVMQGRKVSAHQLGAATPGAVHCQPDDARKPAEEPAEKPAEEPAPKPSFTPVTLPLTFLTLQLPQFQFRPPTPLGQQPSPAVLPMPQLPLGGAGPTFQRPPLSTGLPTLGSLPAPGPLAPLAQPFSPPLVPAAAGAGASTPDLPSRIGIADFGPLSLGLRFGLPVAPQALPGTPPDRRPDSFKVPGAGPSALAVSDFQFELLDMHLNGQVPRGFDAVDKGDLIKACFGIVSTYIAPDLIASLAKSVAGKPGAAFQFDLTLTGDFKGGGITFSLPFDTPPKAYKRPASSGTP